MLLQLFYIEKVECSYCLLGVLSLHGVKILFNILHKNWNYLNIDFELNYYKLNFLIDLSSHRVPELHKQSKRPGTCHTYC